MKKHTILLVALASLIFNFLCWAPPAGARLFPPCQEIFASLENAYTIRYRVTDPISSQIREQTWTLNQGAERLIENVQVHQGILTWIAKYRSGDQPYVYEVHYCIYDPGRGVWKSDAWGPFAGNETELRQHQVKDGVVSWISYRKLLSVYEFRVHYATYDPQYGSWVENNTLWQPPYNFTGYPDTLLVKNGVVTWAMYPYIGQSGAEWYFVIYDQELHQWNSLKVHPGYYPYTIRLLEIPFDSAQVHMNWAQWQMGELNLYYSYDPSAHKWISAAWTHPYRRAFFVAHPSSGLAPFWTCFWDCSVSLDDAVGWVWEPAPNVYFSNRSQAWRYSAPGLYTVTEAVYYYINIIETFLATGQIDVQPPASPTGGSILVNNGDAYTDSANVTLSLKYDVNATHMCFQQSPGLGWGEWQPVAPSLDFILSGPEVTATPPDGPHTVYVKFKDQFGGQTFPSEASIILDTSAPMGTLSLNSGQASTTNPRVRANWFASDAIGLARMQYAAVNEEDEAVVWSHWELYQHTAKTITFSSRPGRKTVMVRFRDFADNVTHIERSIQLKPVISSSLLLLLGD